MRPNRINIGFKSKNEHMLAIALWNEQFMYGTGGGTPSYSWNGDQNTGMFNGEILLDSLQMVVIDLQ